MEIRITKGELVQYGLWRKTCERLNLGDNEAACDFSEIIKLTKEQAVHLGLIVVPIDLDDEDEEDEDDGYEDDCTSVRMRFVEDTELVIISRFNESGEQAAEEERRAFRCGDEVQVTILAQRNKSYDFLFEEGFGAFGVSKDCVQEVE